MAELALETVAASDYDLGMRAFSQVDVFTSEPMFGNPVAVVLDADGMSDAVMAQFANWTNLSETTFVLPPTDPSADYRVRIFTPSSELAFAGHPTIGTCHAWLEAGGTPQSAGSIVQECGIGLVTLRQENGRLAFAAPPLIKDGPVSDDELAPVLDVLGIERDQVIGAQWADNGPGWLAVMLKDAEAVLAIKPDFGKAESEGHGIIGAAPIGLVGTHSDGDVAVEVRAFFSANGQPTEDPVTGSLNAALAQWLLGNGALQSPYRARQGTALGRQGYVHITQAEGEIWVGGDAVMVVSGTTSI